MKSCVPAGALAFGRARQTTKKGRAGPLRAKLKARAAAAKRGRGNSRIMCGIIGIIGQAPVTPLLVDALKRLEYRGYDSAGVATLVNGHIERRRAEGKLSRWEARLSGPPLGGTRCTGR